MVYCVLQIYELQFGKVNNLLEIFSSREKAEEYIRINFTLTNNIVIQPYMIDVEFNDYKGEY